MPPSQSNPVLQGANLKGFPGPEACDCLWRSAARILSRSEIALATATSTSRFAIFMYWSEKHVKSLTNISITQTEPGRVRAEALLQKLRQGSSLADGAALAPPRAVGWFVKHSCECKHVQTHQASSKRNRPEANARNRLPQWATVVHQSSSDTALVQSLASKGARACHQRRRWKFATDPVGKGL